MLVICAITAITAGAVRLFYTPIGGRDKTPHAQYLTLTDRFTHDTSSFTEGLFVRDGELYESTGRKGQSKIMKNIDPTTGIPEKATALSDEIFGEGATYYNGKIYMLTYKSQKGLIFNGETLEQQQALSYPREGWGLTTDGEYLIASDGSSNLYFMDENFNTLKTLKVKYKLRSVRNINELEYINGYIWANVWEEDYIMIISPETGKVEKILSFAELVPDEDQLQSGDSVMNGIAFDPSSGSLYLTGKNWPVLYRFEFKNIEEFPH